MSGLLASLSSAARALDAQRFGLDVAGQNIANVNTPGYTRRTAELASVPAVDALSAGGGATVVGVTSARAGLLEQRLLRERPSEQREQAIAEAMEVVESAIGTPGESLDETLSGFFDALSALAAEPASASARQQVVLQGSAVAAGFREMTRRLDTARRDADTGVRSAVEQINTLSSRVAGLNRSLGMVATGASEGLSLHDELAQALKDLSNIADVSTIARADGGVDVAFANGRPLVVAGTSYAIDAESAPPDSMALVMSGGVDITAEITGGRLGGLLHVRDALLPGYVGDLDAIAFALTGAVNEVHTAGFDRNGLAGGPFFQPLDRQAGAASSIAVADAIATDASRVAAAGTPNAGDNTSARALANLRDARLLTGGATLTDGWAQLVYRVGSDAQAARAEQASRGEIVAQVEKLRDQVSGVSIDEEAMTMMRFQRGYEANARFFQAIDETLDVLMRMVN